MREEESNHGATTIRASKGGGAAKWLLGGLAAIVLIGGGYLVWRTFGPGQGNVQTAASDTYSDTYSEDVERADPLPDSAATDESDATPAASESHSAAPARRSARAVPEETIGVMPASATAEDSDEIVVQGTRRPVWVRTPSERRLTSLYPTRALERGREGEARLRCTVQEGGALDCVRVEETSGVFGNAAMRVARTFRHAPTRADGIDATGTPVNLRVVFRIDDEEGQRYASR